MRLQSPYNMLGVEDSTGTNPTSWGGGAGESRMHFERQPWEMLKPSERREGSTPLHSAIDSLTRRFDPTPALVCPPHSESCKQSYNWKDRML